MKLTSSLSSVLFLSVWPATAVAGEIDYEAAAGCPTRETVIQRTAARAPRARDASVSITRTSSAFVGQVIVGGGEDAVERRVEGRTCDAVVDALVLVLALDRGAADPAPHADEPSIAKAPLPPSSPPGGLLVSARESGAPIHEAAPPPRATIELGAGLLTRYRKLDRHGLLGGEIFGELTLPGLRALPWYRSSLRLGAVALTAYGESSGIVSVSSDTTKKKDTPTSFLGGTVDACFGGAPASTDILDFALLACGAMNVASAGAEREVLWLDAGPIGRATMQLGRKQRTRGFIELSGGALRRLGDALPAPSQTASGGGQSSTPAPADTSWTIAFGGGFVLP